jgi:hypothetical protein|tara:strand:- start:15932 stop:16150 length:219 start_codon:yes stop_codon:yes gene_type:complete
MYKQNKKFREGRIRINTDPNGLSNKQGIDFDIAFIEMLLKGKSLYTQKAVDQAARLRNQLKELKATKKMGVK